MTKSLVTMCTKTYSFKIHIHDCNYVLFEADILRLMWLISIIIELLNLLLNFFNANLIQISRLSHLI